MLQSATVKRVEVMGMGDRVCVDLCSLLVPGEGLLVTYFMICYNNSSIKINTEIVCHYKGEKSGCDR